MTAGADFRLLRAAVFTAACVTLSAAGHAIATGGRPLPLWPVVLACVVVFAVAAPLAGRERSLPGIAALLAVGQLTLHTLFSCGQQPMAQTGTRAAAGSGAGGGGDSGLLALAGQLLCNGHNGGRLTEAEARRVISDAGLSPEHAATQASQTSQAAHAAHGSGAATGGGTGGFMSGGATGGTGPDGPLACLRSAAHAALSLLDLPMVLGHLLVALLLGWLLRRGEAALWRLVRLSARSVAATAAGAGPAGALRRALAYVRALCAGLLPEPLHRADAVQDHDEAATGTVLLQHAVHRRGPPLCAEPTSPAPAGLALAA